MFWSRSTSERRISWRQLIDAGGLLLRKILKLHLNYLCNYLYYTISIYLHKNRCIKFPQIIFFQTKHSRTSTSLVNIFFYLNSLAKYCTRTFSKLPLYSLLTVFSVPQSHLIFQRQTRRFYLLLIDYCPRCHQYLWLLKSEAIVEMVALRYPSICHLLTLEFYRLSKKRLTQY